MLTACCDEWVKRFGGNERIHGNCANWTSRALNLAGITATTHQFPKAIWVDIFQQMCLESTPERAKVVYFHRYKPGSGSPSSRTRVCPGLVSPVYCLRDCVFQSLVKYANIEVYLQEDENGNLVAKSERGQGVRPSWCTKYLIIYFHAFFLTAVIALYLLFGWPTSEVCDSGPAWTLKILIVLAFMVIHGTQI